VDGGYPSDYVRPSGSYASDVTDREWALIAPLLPTARTGGRPRTTCLRRVVNAIFYVLQAGCQWRMLPRDFPPRSTVYGYFRAWIAAGVWAHVHDVLYRRTRELEGRDESPTAAIIDSQSVRTSAEAREMVGYDAGKRIKGRKRHLVTDTLGLMLRIEVHSASVQDRDGAARVLDRITRRFPFLERIFADAGYQGPRVAAAAPRPVEIIKRTDAGFVVQPKRWVVERTFAWASVNRRLARDFEGAAATARAFFQIAMIKLMIRRIARYRGLLSQTLRGSFVDRSRGDRARRLLTELGRHPHSLIGAITTLWTLTAGIAALLRLAGHALAVERTPAKLHIPDPLGDKCYHHVPVPQIEADCRRVMPNSPCRKCAI
jgi:transposase